MEPLTRRQSRVLTFIKDYLKKKGFPPTRREIALSVGSKYPNTATDHLKALVKKGYITRIDGIARGIKINGEKP